MNANKDGMFFIMYQMDHVSKTRRPAQRMLTRPRGRICKPKDRLLPRVSCLHEFHV